MTWCPSLSAQRSMVLWTASGRMGERTDTDVRTQPLIQKIRTGSRRIYPRREGFAYPNRGDDICGVAAHLVRMSTCNSPGNNKRITQHSPSRQTHAAQILEARDSSSR